MPGYSPRDSQMTDEMDPFQHDPEMAARIRSKNDDVYKKNNRLTIILIALVVALLCAIAVFLIIFFATQSSPPSTTPDGNQMADKSTYYEDCVEEEEEAPKAHGQATTGDKEPVLCIPNKNGELIPIKKEEVAPAPAPDSMRVREGIVEVRIVPTTPSNVVAADELPEEVPSMASFSDETYGFIDIDDLYEDCEQVRKGGHRTSGVYELNVDGKRFNALCLMEGDHAWMVLQRRTNGDLSFNRTFEEYANGFGSVKNNHWLGLEKVYQYVKKGHSLQLRIELRGDTCKECSKLGGQGYWWGDWKFAIGSKQDKYKLDISRILHGNLTDPDMDEFYELNNGRGFTTYDQDNDSKERMNCASFRKYGPWWHQDCTMVALNGIYGGKGKSHSGMFYLHHQDAVTYAIKPQMSLMMVRIVKNGQQ